MCFCLSVFHIQTIFYFLESSYEIKHDEHITTVGCKAVTSREVSLELSQENRVNICPDLPLICIHIFEGLQVNMEAEGRIIGCEKEPAGMGLEYRGEQLGARPIMKTRPK